MLQPAMRSLRGGIPLAPPARVILGGEDERGEPEVAEGQVQRQEVAAVGLDGGQDGGEEVEEQGDDGDDLVEDEVGAAAAGAAELVQEVREDARDDGRGGEDHEVVEA